MSISHNLNPVVRLDIADICLNEFENKEILHKAYLMDVIVNMFTFSKNRTRINNKALGKQIKIYEKRYYFGEIANKQ